MHEQSHGESFLALVNKPFTANGLYLLDEPEAALSPQGCLALLRRVHDLVADGSQFIIATHSPLLIAYPDAIVYEFGEDGVVPRRFDETETYRLFEDFLAAPGVFLHHLLRA